MRSEVKRCIDDWAGRSLALGECSVPKRFCQGGGQAAVVLPCFLGESKETKECERGEDDRPPIEQKDLKRVHQDLWILVDAGVFPMRVILGNPWTYTANQDIQFDVPTGQRDGEKETNGGYCNETPVNV